MQTKKYKRQLEKQKRKSKKPSAWAEKKRAKDGMEPQPEARKRVYVLDFECRYSRSDVDLLREEISAVLTFARKEDEIVVRLESGGGMVHSYGLAASQLKRIRDCGIHLTVCVDRVAASGGYMMACLADKVVAAPFAIIGSIGVVAQLPNFHRLLKRNDVDFENVHRR